MNKSRDIYNKDGRNMKGTTVLNKYNIILKTKKNKETLPKSLNNKESSMQGDSMKPLTNKMTIEATFSKIRLSTSKINHNKIRKIHIQFKT